MAKKISVTLVKSTIGQTARMRATVRSLGLRKLHASVEHEVNPAILGMVARVSHLVRVKEL